MQSGFTIVELLITITVLSILVGVSFANYSKTNQRQLLIAAGETIKNTLRDAQSRAYTGEIDCSVCDCTAQTGSHIDGWSVDITQKTLYGQCSAGEFSSTPFTVDDDIVITSYTQPEGPIFFRRYPPGAQATGTICLSHRDLPNSYYSVTISASGEISDATALSATCP